MPLTQSQIDAIIAENERLKARLATGGPISFKVSPKGGLSMYGMGRWPLTLYASQWRKVLGNVEAIRKALADFADQLTEKPEQAETHATPEAPPAPGLRKTGR